MKKKINRIIKSSSNFHIDQHPIKTHYINWNEGHKIFRLSTVRKYDGNWSLPLVMFLVHCCIQFRVML
jgi:hypothetical protein